MSNPYQGKVLPIHVQAITSEMNHLSTIEQKELGKLCRKLDLGEQLSF